MNYSNMKATKVSKQKLDPNISISRSSSKKAKRYLSKVGISWIAVVICLVVGLLGGFLTAKLAFKNDTFEMTAYASGSIDINIGADEEAKTYTELGVKCIAFGKDISSDCTVTYYFRDELTQDAVKVDKVDEKTPGIYYAVYKCSNIKFSSVTLIRNIIVLKEEDNG